MIDTLRSAVLPKGVAEDVVVADSTAYHTVARASDLAPPAGAAGTGRPAAHGSFEPIRAPRPWVAGAKARANRC